MEYGKSSGHISQGAFNQLPVVGICIGSTDLQQGLKRPNGCRFMGMVAELSS
jgi:hypothetical protein